MRAALLAVALLFLSDAGLCSYLSPAAPIKGSVVKALSATQTGIGFTYTATGTYYPFFVSDPDGCSGMTCNTNGTITILTPGKYMVSFVLTFNLDGANYDLDMVVLKNGAATEIKNVRINTSGSINSFAACGDLDLVAGDILAVGTRIDSSGAGAIGTLYNFSLCASK